MVNRLGHKNYINFYHVVPERPKGGINHPMPSIQAQVHKPNNGFVKPPQSTLVCFPSSCSLSKPAIALIGLCMCPKEQ